MSLQKRLLIVSAVLALGLPVATSSAFAQKATMTRTQIGEKIHSLSEAELKRIVGIEFFGDSDTVNDYGDQENVNSVKLDGVKIDDVVILGNFYTLIFMDSDDVLPWSYYKPFLPDAIKTAPAAAMTDEQVLARLQKMSADAKAKYDALAAKAWQAHPERFAKKYPNQTFDDMNDHYDHDENDDIAPEAQQAYNEYEAIGELTLALQGYMKIKKDF